MSTGLSMLTGMTTLEDYNKVGHAFTRRGFPTVIYLFSFCSSMNLPQRKAVMKEVTRSNLKLSMTSKSSSVLREQALAGWRFQPSGRAKNQDTDTARIFQASQRDMEIVTRALERELNSRPDDGVIHPTSNEKNARRTASEVALSSMSSCDPGSLSQVAEEAKASPLISDSMAPGTGTPAAEALSRSCNNEKSIPAMNNFSGKRPSQRGNGAPITFCVLREQALAAWRFQPSDMAKNQDTDTAWIFQASQRDMETVTKALERELNSRPGEEVVISTSNKKNAGPSPSEVMSPSMSFREPGSPSQAGEEAKASLGVSDSMASRNRTPPAEPLSTSCSNKRSISVMNDFIGKRRSQRGNRSPITIMTADSADFQAIVQQMTGFAPESSSRAAPSLLKPLPKRPGQIGNNNTPSALFTFDSSSLGPINGLFDTRSSYPNSAALCNNLAEKSMYSVGTVASSSHFHSMGIEQANALQCHVNAFGQMDFWN